MLTSCSKSYFKLTCLTLLKHFMWYQKGLNSYLNTFSQSNSNLGSDKKVGFVPCFVWIVNYFTSFFFQSIFLFQEKIFSASKGKIQNIQLSLQNFIRIQIGYLEKKKWNNLNDFFKSRFKAFKFKFCLAILSLILLAHFLLFKKKWFHKFLKNNYINNIMKTYLQFYILLNHI